NGRSGENCVLKPLESMPIKLTSAVLLEELLSENSATTQPLRWALFLSTTATNWCSESSSRSNCKYEKGCLSSNEFLESRVEAGSTTTSSAAFLHANLVEPFPSPEIFMESAWAACPACRG